MFIHAKFETGLMYTTNPPFTLEEFNALHTAISPDLLRIAYRTKGEYTFEDMRGEAWEEADRMLTSGIDDSISSPEFAKKIIKRLRTRLVKWSSKIVRHAIRIDADSDEDSDRFYWVDSAIASAESDPVVQLVEREETQALEQAQEKRLKSSYSEVVAYFRLLENFNSDREAIAEHLGLSWHWIWRKIKRATDLERQQDSLFDRIRIIDENFVPPPSRFKRRKLLSRSERKALEHQKRLRQLKLFPRAYVPIKLMAGHKCSMCPSNNRAQQE